MKIHSRCWWPRRTWRKWRPLSAVPKVPFSSICATCWEPTRGPSNIAGPASLSTHWCDSAPDICTRRRRRTTPSTLSVSNGFDLYCWSMKYVLMWHHSPRLCLHAWHLGYTILIIFKLLSSCTSLYWPVQHSCLFCFIRSSFPPSKRSRFYGVWTGWETRRAEGWQDLAG